MCGDYDLMLESENIHTVKGMGTLKINVVESEVLIA